MKLAKKQRVWDYEKFQRDQGVQNTKGRITQIENLLLEILSLCSEFMYLLQYDPEELLQRDSLTAKALLIHQKIIHLQALSNLFWGPEVEIKVNAFTKLASDFVIKIPEVIESMGESGYKKQYSELGEIYGNLSGPVTEVISVLDGKLQQAIEQSWWSG